MEENKENDILIKSEPSVQKIKYEDNFYYVISYYGEWYDVKTELPICKIGEEQEVL